MLKSLFLFVACVYYLLIFKHTGTQQDVRVAFNFNEEVGSRRTTTNNAELEYNNRCHIALKAEIARPGNLNDARTDSLASLRERMS